MVAPLSVIVVEDDDDLREVTVEYLNRKGHHAIGVDCAEAVDDEVGAMPMDLLIVDVSLPSEDGLSLTRRFREAQPDIGIIILTGRAKVSDRLDGYRNGADIYLTKPASMEELLAAVAALSRRLARRGEEARIELFLSALRLRGPAGECGVSPVEAALLAGLARAPGHRLETWQLLELAGKAEHAKGKSLLEVHLSRLRKKLVEVGAPPRPIKAMRLTGYQLGASVTLR